MIQLMHGDCLEVLKGFEPGTFDAVITDPPYSSGGMSLGSKSIRTSEKYTATKKKCPYPDFEGDNKDQRSWTSWCAQWLGLARQASKDGAVVAVFSDWRQLPSLTDALQWAGWIWRGIVIWDKKNARPQKGRPRQQAEFVVWGSNGQMPVTRNAPTLPGVFAHAMPAVQTRKHQTQKPIELMHDLIRIVEPGGHILDPFCGSGTTLEAARDMGYDATGIEMSKEYHAIASERLGCA